MGDIVVDVAVREEAGTLLLPSPLAETIPDAVLAIGQTLLYCGTHLKSFAHCGFLASCISCYYSQVPRESKVRARTLPQYTGGLACFRTSDEPCCSGCTGACWRPARSRTST